MEEVKIKQQDDGFYYATIKGFNNDTPVWKGKSLSRLMFKLAKYFKSQEK